MSSTTTNDIAGMEWVAAAVRVMVACAADKLSAPDALRFGALDAMGAEAWSERDRMDAHARLRRYAAVLKLHGVRWRPAPGAAVVEEAQAPQPGRAVSAWNGRFLLRSFFSDVTGRAAVQAVAGAQWNGSAFAVRASVGAADAVRGLAGMGFALDEQAEALLAEVEAGAGELAEASRAAAGALRVEGLAGEPRPYQSAGVEYMARVKKGFLADDMGLGKTLQALAAVQHLGAWPALVVTLSSVKNGWRSECERWLPGVRVVVWEGRGKDEERRTKDEAARTLHVVNYDIVKDRLEELKEIGIRALILDEVHFLKNGKSKRTEALKKLARGVPVRMGLTGTPVLNRPSELIPQLQVLGRLDDLGGFWKFVERYCDAKQVTHGRQATHWDMGGASNLAELHERLRSVCFLRRTKEQVLPELPPQIVTRVPLTLTADGRRLYEQAAGNLKEWLAERAACGKDWEAEAAHLSEAEREYSRQERIAEALERLDGMELLQRMAALGQVAAEAKLAPAAEWIRETCAGRKLVLFGHHVSVMREGLMKMVGPELGAVLIDGSTSTAARAAAVRRFQTDDKCRLALLNLTAGGTGLDGLQKAAHHVAFVEWPWTPASLNQATARLDRLGQRHCVNVWHLVAPGTVDIERLYVLAAKAKVCDAVTDGDSRAQAMAAARDVARGIFNAAPNN